MSHTANSVIVVGAFGRTEDLAIDLQRAGFDVTLLDATEYLGQGQDLGVGPFPVTSGAAALEGSLKEHDLERGLSFWLPEGPFELSGSMAGFHQAANPAVQWLLDAGGRRRQRDFSIDWLAQYMYQLASPWLSNPTLANLGGTLFPFKEKLVLLNNSTFLKGLKKATADEGVKRYQIKQWLGLEMSDGRISELKFATDLGEIAVSASSVVWALSSWESQKLNAELAPQIFSSGIMDPDWQWVRFDLRSSVGSWISGIPYWTAVVQDIYLPWTHANSFIVIKGSGGNWDAWLKVPFNRLSEPSAWHAWARGVETVLNGRLPHGQFVCDESSLKTCPQGLVFERERAYHWRPPSINNFHYCAHETLSRLDLGCWYESLEKLIPALTDTKTKEMKKAKGARSDHALHAP